MTSTAFRPSLPPAATLGRAAIALVAVLITVWAQWMAPSSRSLGNELLRDRFVKMQASTEPEPRILVIDIDEASTTKLGPWPWPRERIADLVETLLTHYAARGVALDIMMPDAAAGGSDGDLRLAMLAEHGPLVLATAFDYQVQRGEPVREGVMPTAAARDAADVPALNASGFIGNHAGLSGARFMGNIGFIPDADGVLRRIPMYTRYDGHTYPALTLALMECCSGGRKLAMQPELFTRIPYSRDWSAYDVVSAADILDHSLDAPSVANRLVLVGSSSLGLGDRVTTPLAAQRPGLGVHAAMLSGLLDRQAGLEPARWPGKLIALAYAVLMAAATMVALARVPALASIALLSLFSAGWLAVAYVVAPHDPDFGTSSPLASALFLVAAAIPFQWQLTQQRSRRLLSTLRQYVARAVVDELLRRNLNDPLKPAQRDVTTLIADMEGYTAQVESLSAEDAATLTIEFLSCLTAPVLSHQGTLDKYTGDGLVAFWGAPLPNEDHADLALTAAREIVASVERLSCQRVAAGYQPLRVRIGIESGPAMAGDFGTEFRSIYTAVGDSVNTASRLEQAARDFPHSIIIGAGTVRRAMRHEFLWLEERCLRGKEKPTALYTLAGNHPGASKAQSAEPTEIGALQ